MLNIMQTNTKTTTEPMSEVFATKKYTIFKYFPGNRSVDVKHVNELTKDIANNNLLYANPILVNRDMQIIDGQHRLEVAKNNNLTIYYMVIDSASLSLVQELNASQKPWSAIDYLRSYAAIGNTHYQYLQELCKDNPLIKINTMLYLVKGSSGGGIYKEFKRGKLVIENHEEVEDRISAYMAIKPYVVAPAWRDREFITALSRVLELKPIEELLSKFEISGWVIEQQLATKDYLREFERLVNFRKQNTERLF